MKNLRLLFVFILVFAFAACSDDDKNSIGQGQAILFNSSINGTVTQTKASDTTWGLGDAIGVYMKTGTGLGNIVDQGANKKYTTPGTGKFSPANTASDALYYPGDNSNVDFIAYYPYTDNITNYIYKVDVSSQSSQETIDLLYSDNATGLSNNNSAVTLNFEHQLSKVVFTVNAGNGITSLSDLKVTIKGTATKADFALANKTLTAPSSIADIVLKSTNGNLQSVAEGIILPAEGVAGRVVTFTTLQGEFKWEVPSTTVFEAGKKNTYTVELKMGGDNIVYPESTITDWGTGSSENIVIDLEESADGSESSPYTVSKALGKSGETAKWVTGYIVGSTTKTKSFGSASTNILLAETADETDESKCIPVDIDGSIVQNNLDIVANPDLVGKIVKVQGDIVNILFGGAISITNVVQQVGGASTGGGTIEEYFYENFGPDDVKYASAERPSVASNTAWNMTAPVTYTDASGNIDIRTTNTLTPSAWFPANKESSLLIENIDGSYKNITLSYDIAAGSGTGNAEGNTMKVYCNGVLVDIPSTILATTNTYATINVSIPDNTTTIEFKLESSSTIGFRLDEIRLKGAK